MTGLEWKRVRAGEYRSEASRCRFTIERINVSRSPWYWHGTHPKGSAGGRARTLAEAKATVAKQLAEWRGRYGAV